MRYCCFLFCRRSTTQLINAAALYQFDKFQFDRPVLAIQNICLKMNQTCLDYSQLREVILE